MDAGEHAAHGAAGQRGATMQFISVKVNPMLSSVNNRELHIIRVVLKDPVGVHFPPSSSGRPRRQMMATGVVLDFRTRYGPPFVGSPPN